VDFKNFAGIDARRIANYFNTYLFLRGTGIGFLTVGVPGAGLWALLVLILAFVGALGGFVASGIIGLFVGAIILALSYKLFLAWLNGGI
jgi:predicted PurR-regulated permease PerM